MGGSGSRFEVAEFTPSDWRIEKENGYCILLRNIHTGELVEEYDMLPKGDLTIQEQLEFYQYRKKQNKHLVSVHHIRKGDSAGLCTGKDYYKVFTERIPIRLTEIDYLTFPEALTVIRDSLIGYNEIKESYFGILKVTKEMIGFTPGGEVKVWINQEFKFNSPERKHIMKGYGNSLVLVTQVFSLVQESMAEKQFPESFRNQMKRLDEGLTYETAIAFVTNYAKGHNIQLPHRINILKISGNIDEDDFRQPDSIVIQTPVPPVMVNGIPVTKSIHHEKLNIPKTNQPYRPPNQIIHHHNHLQSQIKNLPQTTPNLNKNNPGFQRDISPARYHQQFQQQMNIPQVISQQIIPVENERQRINRHERNYSDVVPVQVRPADNLPGNKLHQPNPNLNNHNTRIPYEPQKYPAENISRRSPDTRVLGVKNIKEISPQHSERNNRLISHHNVPTPNTLYPNETTHKYGHIVQSKYTSNHERQGIQQNPTPSIHHNISQPLPQLQAHKKASPKPLNTPNQYLQPDSLNQKLDQLSATIANMNKQFQGDKLNHY